MQTIQLLDGTVLTITPITVGASATLIVPAATAGDITVINNGTSVMDLGDNTVTPGTGLPLQPGGGSITLSVPAVAGSNRTPTALYAAYPGGSGDCRVVQRS